MSRWFEMKHTIFVVDFFSIKWVEVIGVGSFFLHVGSTSNTQVKIILDRKEIDLHVGRPYTNLESALLTDETPLRGNTNPPIYLRYAFGIHNFTVFFFIRPSPSGLVHPASGWCSDGRYCGGFAPSKRCLLVIWLAWLCWSRSWLFIVVTFFMCRAMAATTWAISVWTLCFLVNIHCLSPLPWTTHPDAASHDQYK